MVGRNLAIRFKFTSNSLYPLASVFNWYCARLNYFLLILVPSALRDPIPSTVAKAKYANINKVLAACLNHPELCIIMVTVPVTTGGDGMVLGWCFSQVRSKGDLI